MQKGLPWWLSDKEPAFHAGTTGDLSSIPESEDPLEKGMATHSSTLVRRISWAEEPDRLQSAGLQRVGRD